MSNTSTLYVFFNCNTCMYNVHVHVHVFIVQWNLSTLGQMVSLVLVFVTAKNVLFNEMSSFQASY